MATNPWEKIPVTPKEIYKKGYDLYQELTRLKSIPKPHVDSWFEKKTKSIKNFFTNLFGSSESKLENQTNSSSYDL